MTNKLNITQQQRDKIAKIVGVSGQTVFVAARDMLLFKREPSTANRVKIFKLAKLFLAHNDAISKLKAEQDKEVEKFLKTLDVKY